MLRPDLFRLRSRHAALVFGVGWGLTAGAAQPAENQAAAAPVVEASAPHATDRPAPRPIKRLDNPYLRLPLQQVGVAPPPPGPPAAETTADVLELPKMIIPGLRIRPPALPVVAAPAPVRNLPADPFETPGARRARLVQKYFTTLEQKLGHRSELEARAEQLERDSALDDIAAILELSAATGIDDTAEQARLRAEYLTLFYSRPR